MNFTEIKQNVRNWNAIRTNSSALKSLFVGDTTFSFDEISTIGEPGLSLHFYPAVESDGLYLYIIEKKNDKFSVYNENPGFFPNYIIKSKLIDHPHSDYVEILGRITENEALERIKSWKEHHVNWIDQNSTTVNMFQAFSMHIDNSEINDGPLIGFFGLNEFSPDMVFKNDNAAYFNTVRPVPPFHPSENEGDFFILVASLLE